jgi:hypothetical protein
LRAFDIRQFPCSVTKKPPRAAGGEIRLGEGYLLGRRAVAGGELAKAIARRAAMPRGLAIFDFDCTLTKFHVWGRFRKAPLPEVLIDADTFVDLQAFKAFVQKARSQDLEVAIATFGRRDVVNKALEYALGERHDIAISTPADHVDPRYDFPNPMEDEPPRCAEGSDILGDKNAQIAALCERFGVSVEDASLADDDPNNVQKAVDSGIGYVEHAVRGADAACLERILRHFGAA